MAYFSSTAVPLRNERGVFFLKKVDTLTLKCVNFVNFL